MNEPVTVRGRTIGREDLVLIKEVVSQHWGQGRQAISRELCRLWNWRQANGHLKDQVCRILLKKLEDLGAIALPAPKRGISNHPRWRYYIPPDPPPEVSMEPLEGILKRPHAVRLEMVRRTPGEVVWNYLVHRFHYKSYRILVGAHLKYLAYAGDRPVACLAWSSSVFRIRSRDAFIGWCGEVRSRNIRHVANNSRFLILPWVRMTNLASHLLGLSARVIARDWEAFYGYPLVLLETFVDQSRFQGTCYKAANWTRVGETAGHAKKGGRFYYHGHKKDVYLYPLVADFRERLEAPSLEGGAR
jgi:hypothetical protein